MCVRRWLSAARTVEGLSVGATLCFHSSTKFLSVLPAFGLGIATRFTASRYGRSASMASVLNALSSLREVLGVSVVNAIEGGIDERCFMLGGVDRHLSKLPAKAGDYMKTQLSELVAFFGRAILPPPPAVARPVYDPTGI